MVALRERVQAVNANIGNVISIYMLLALIEIYERFRRFRDPNACWTEITKENGPERLIVNWSGIRTAR